MTAALVLALLFVMLAASVPVGFAMGIAGSTGLLALGGPDMLVGIMRTSALSSVRSYEIITIPMFLLMAEFILLSKVADDLFTALSAWVGRIPGGLGIATALAGAGFGAICGSSTVAAATLASTSLPAMLKRGYEPQLAAGVVAISGTLAMLLPTSIALVLYGILADVSVGKLLVSGILPALLITCVIVATVLVLVRARSVACARESVGSILREASPAASCLAYAGAVRHRHRDYLLGDRHADRGIRPWRTGRFGADVGHRPMRSRSAFRGVSPRGAGQLHDRVDPAGRSVLFVFLHLVIR